MSSSFLSACFPLQRRARLDAARIRTEQAQDLSRIVAIDDFASRFQCATATCTLTLALCQRQIVPSRDSGAVLFLGQADCCSASLGLVTRHSVSPVSGCSLPLPFRLERDR